MDAQYLIVNHVSLKDLTRIFSKITIDPEIQWNGTPCWVWTAAREKRKGFGSYGRMTWKNKQQFPHRFMYAWLVESIPPYSTGASIDHLCRNTRCCNPLHLELVPIPVNIRRGGNPTVLNAAKVYCSRGHLLAPAYTWPSKTQRRCFICQNMMRQIRRNTRRAQGLPAGN